MNRKRIFAVLVAAFLLPGLFVGMREPLLAGMGRWLVAETLLQQADLVVALGGGRERQEEAVRLFQVGMARWVLFVGADVRPRDYHCLDVPDGHAVLPLPAPAYTTHEEAVATRAIAHARGFSSVLIVTSPYHVRRARWTFEQVFKGSGVAVLVAAAPQGAFSMDAWWKSYIGCKLVLTEYLGLGFYWCRFGGEGKE